MSAVDDLPIDLLLVADPTVYERDHRPMYGRPLRVEWSNLRTWLSRPSITTRKEELGAWTPCLFRDGRKKKDHLIHACALTIDIDENGNAERIAEHVAGYESMIHSTFQSTPEKPRCRLVHPFAEPVDASTYERVWKVVAAHLGSAGVTVDRSAKDSGRLNYLPCIPSGAQFRFRHVVGAPLHAKSILDAQPPEPARVVTPLPAPEHRDRYVRAALTKAAHAIATTSEGQRHYQLSKEAFGLARLGLADREIEEALLPAFILAAGERRRDEGARTIRDAVRARVA